MKSKHKQSFSSQMTFSSKIHIFGIAILVAVSSCGFLSAAELKHSPLDPRAEAAYRKAIELGRHRDTLHSAVKHIAEAVRLQPQNANYWCAQASILHDLEEDEQAVTSINKALELDKKKTYAWQVDSMILAALKQQPAALAAADSSIKTGGGKEAHIQRACVLSNMGRFAQAVQELDLVIKHNPDCNLARENRMVATEHLGDFNKYIVDCNFFLRPPQLCTNESKMLARRAKAYSHLKQYEKAIFDYKTAVKLMPDMRQAHAGLLEIYRTTGDTNNAVKEKAFLKKLDDDLGF